MLTRDSGSRRKEKRGAAVVRARSGARDASNRLKDVRILLEVATRISGTETLDEVLEALVEMTSLRWRKLTPSKRCTDRFKRPN